jgi:hypothetical protein
MEAGLRSSANILYQLNFCNNLLLLLVRRLHNLELNGMMISEVLSAVMITMLF